MGKPLRNISLLFIMQIFGYLIPIIEIPILARALGVDAYGKIVLVQSVALLASLFMEYGFGISGTRQVALAKNEKSTIERIFGEILSAKIIIAGVILAVVGVALWMMDLDVENETVFFGFLYFLAFGFSPMWLFQGMERLSGVLSIELVLRCAGLLSLIVFVQDADDYDVALCLMALFAFANTLVGNVLCRAWVDRIRLNFAGAVEQIKSGCNVFIYKSANNILMNSGPLLVSLSAGAQALALYVPAEKMIKGLVGIAAPVLMGIFPLINRSFKTAARPPIFLSVLISAALMFLGVLIASVVTYAGSELVLLALGPDFEKVTDVLRIFVWIVPLRMLNQSLGLTVLIPMHKDSVLGAVSLISSVVAMLCVIGFSVIYGARGAAAGFVLAELLLCMSLVFCVAKAWRAARIGLKATQEC